MARVVGIHGIGHTYRTSPQLETAWFDALAGGLEEAGYPRLKREDYAGVAYGSFYRREGTRAAGAPPLVTDDIKDDWEKEMLDAWWREAARLAVINREPGGKDLLGEDPSIQGPEFQGRARTPALVQRALKQLSKSRYFAALGPERILIFELRQVRLYLHDPELRRAALDRAAAKITPETRVVIGHSLGSVVAYEALCEHREWQVDTFITLGSPLGIRNLVFERLTPKPEGAKGVRPPVRRWVNIADSGDIVALEKRLAQLFADVEDVAVHNGWKSHDVERYLTATATGRAIALGLELATGRP
jgi:hypothetical protein